MQLSEIKPGEHVAWDTWLGPTTVLIEGVNRFRVSYVHSDGVRGAFEATRYDTLEHSVRMLRAATVEEMSAFETLRSPAPANYAD